MTLALHNGGRQGVERHHVRDLLRLGILHHKAVDDALARQHPVMKVLLADDRRKLKPTQSVGNTGDEKGDVGRRGDGGARARTRLLFQVLCQKRLTRLHVLLLHWAKARRLLILAMTGRKGK